MKSLFARVFSRTFILCAALVFAFSACGDDGDEDAKGGDGGGDGLGGGASITYELYQTYDEPILLGTLKVEERDEESVYLTVTPIHPDFEADRYGVRLWGAPSSGLGFSTRYVGAKVRQEADFEFDAITDPERRLEVQPFASEPTGRADKETPL